MMTSKTIFPLNGSGFGGTLDTAPIIPPNTQWEVEYKFFEFMQPQLYLNICKAKSGSPLLVKSIKFATTVSQLNTTLIKFVRRLITGLQVSRLLKLEANNKMYQGVRNVKFDGDIALNYETSLELDISPNTTVTMYIEYEKQKDDERIFPEIPNRNSWNSSVLRHGLADL